MSQILTFFKIFVFVYLLKNVGASIVSAQEEPLQLPFCDDAREGLVLVSTIDGKFFTLNASTGNVLWELETSGPLLTSSIHNIELTTQGEQIRIIPSLKGGLYKFNMKTIDAIPIDADNLLKSSHLYLANIVIAGHRDVKTFGVTAHSGKEIYECSASGCENKTNNEVHSENIVIIERVTTCVRAHEPRTGQERWNFSVGYNNLRMSLSGCGNYNPQVGSLNITAVIPTGELSVYQPGAKGGLLWKYTFESPIVNVWKWDGKDLTMVDLFQTSASDGNPSFYLGVFDRQLYIDESNRLGNEGAYKLVDSNSQSLTGRGTLPQIPFKPISALAVKLNEHDQITAASNVLWNSDSLAGKGYYFLTENKSANENTICINNSTKSFLKKYLKVENFYLTELTLILLTSLVVTKIFWDIGSERFFQILRLQRVADGRSKRLSESDNKDSGANSTELNIIEQAESVNSENQENTSRFMKDFETVSCLGRGGYGVVFEVKQKIDEHGYAIKRIVLPQKPTLQARVLREVRALAKLDHINIVRYCTSWVEKPTHEWRVQFDKQWQNNLDSIDGIPTTYEESTTTTTKSRVTHHKRTNSTVITIASEEDTNTGNDDSFIVFKNDTEETEEECNVTESVSTSHKFEVTFGSTKSSNSKSIPSEQSETKSKSNVVVEIERVDTVLYIQMQLCKKESLKDWLNANVERNNEDIIHIYSQILSAVDYVHRQKLIHRDLKPSNIFFSHEGHVKVGDFGLVTSMKEAEILEPVNNYDSFRSYTRGAGTALYMSPEQLSNKDYNYKVDIFSLGVILFELLVVFTTASERIKVLTDLRSGVYPKGFSQKFPSHYDLLQKMLSHNPHDRPDVADIIKTVKS